MTIPDFGSDLLGVAARTAIVYVVLVIFFRVAGKREAGQLSTLDLIVLLVISNAVQNAMVGENVTLIGGLLAAGIILALDRGLHFLMDRSKTLHEVIEGEPVLLVEDGRILHDHLRSEGISDRELAVALRQNGLLTAAEARFVYFETNGQISVIPRRADQDESDDTEFDPDDAGEATADEPGHALSESEAPARPRRRRRPGKLSGTSP